MADKRKTTKKPTRSSTKRTTAVVAKKNATAQQNSVLDFFRFGESYTSLVLGIIVVIAVAAFLVTFSRTRSTSPETPSKDISATSTAQLGPVTATPSQLAVTEATETPQPTVVTATTTPVPTALPTARPTLTQTPTVAVTTPTPTNASVSSGKTYTVQAGDDLWNIAVKAYGDGYQWSNIAHSNNLSNPDVIAAGTIITLPAKLDSQMATDQLNNPSNAPNAGSIAGTTYTVQAGDDLWDIAVRAYGNGYRWVDIAKANNLLMPGIIHNGNILKLPR